MTYELGEPPFGLSLPGKIIVLHGGRGAGKTHWALLWVSLAPQQRRYATKLKDALEYSSWGLDVVLDSDKISRSPIMSMTAAELRSLAQQERGRGYIVKSGSTTEEISDPWEPTK